MRAGSWYADPARPDCDHADVEGTTVEVHGDAEPTPAEKCRGCRALRLFHGRPELTVAYRAEPLAFNKAAFPEPAAEKPRTGWRRPSFIPEDWWNGSPPKRYA